MGCGADGIFGHFSYKVFIINYLTVILGNYFGVGDRPNES
jgi:hypothetical protein